MSIKKMNTELQKLGRNTLTFVLKKGKRKNYESKLGGMLYIEDKKNYPRDSKGNLMMFLCQLNLRDFNGFYGLPNNGILQFFIPNPKYFKYDDHEPCKVLFISNYNVNNGLVKNVFLSEFKDMVPYEYECGVTLIKELVDYPNPSNDIFNEIAEQCFKNGDYPDTVFNKYYKRGHKIGGYPFYNQFETIEDDEILLLQIDSSEKCDLMFGDDGTCRFYIKKDDLAKGDFSKVRFDIDFC